MAGSESGRALDGRVAVVTGAARGQGRAHALRLAEHGADLILVDSCAGFPGQGYPPADAADLAETGRRARELGVRVIAETVDVRDHARLDSTITEGAREFGGRLDIVVANAGISAWGKLWEISREEWDEVVGVNLTGVWLTLKACVPTMIEAGRGGSIIITSSVAGIKPLPAQAHYSAAKHGVVGLMKTAALELAPYGIRVNALHPWAVDTPMATDGNLTAILRANTHFLKSFGQVLDSPAIAAPEDIADAALWLATDASRTVTGASIPVDLGATSV
ncbi:mycofactocin-coupled SDR family oxidoreductase [Nocardia sp. NPDC050799]|uniref:mycofactocin-coupled SDR family oxidoreductase n=1 Tax=Nocardia sp. NPDC050799 TaxID=3154842 RepID=UPI0033CC7372